MMVTPAPSPHTPPHHHVVCTGWPLKLFGKFDIRIIRSKLSMSILRNSSLQCSQSESRERRLILHVTSQILIRLIELDEALVHPVLARIPSEYIDIG